MTQARKDLRYLSFTHTQLFGIPGVDLEEVLLAPVYEVLKKFSVGSVVIVPDKADDSRVIREIL